ncbi:MAG: DUF1538 domain-containing protein [Alphaproteobacteria bacterium]|nr:DUF1538 domain-containing protein [Alphaproteobacteria bacterium]
MVPALLQTIADVLPIILLLFVFQIVVLRRPLRNPGRKLVGLAYVVGGLALFGAGLEGALFPLGRSMAAQLTAPDFLGIAEGVVGPPNAYLWVYVFAAAIGFATTVAEPALITVSLKAEQVSAGTIRAFPLRLAVALGVAIGVALGTYRIVTGTPLYWYIIAGYLLVAAQTIWAQRIMIPIAYDSGGVTTSTVTVPVVSALGISLAATIPGRSPIIDGFGLIAFASLFPIISVLAYAWTAAWVVRYRRRTRRREDR